LLAVLFGAGLAPAQELTLPQALDLARQRAPLILSARARIAEAKGRLTGALVRFRDNPLVEFDAGPRFTPQGNLATIDAGVSQNFELGGRRAARIAGAEAGVARETAASDDAARLLLRDVSIAFARALWSQKRLELLWGSERLAAEFLDSAQKRFDAGDIPALDLNLAKTSAVRARAEVRTATVDLTEALGDLRVFLGMAPEDPLAIRGDLRDRPQLNLDALLVAAVDRPDLRAIAAELREAGSDAQLGEAFKWPDLALGAKYSRDEGNNIVQGGLKLTLPVFSRGQELQATGNARSSRLRFELDSAARTARSEVRTAWDSQRFRAETVAEIESAVLPALDENDSLAARSYEEGQIGLPELILIRRETLETRLLYANSLLDAFLASVDLQFRSGVLR